MDFRKKKILVADANPYILASLPEQLGSYFSEVTSVDKHDKLFLLCKEESYDVLLLDLNFAIDFPEEKEEKQNFGLINNLSKQNSNLIIVIMTRSEDVKTAQKMLEAGAKDFVLKPWNPEKLKNNVIQLLYIKDLEEKLLQLKLLRYKKKHHDESLNLQDNEKQCIEKALFAYQGNMTHAARKLGITRATLYAKIKKYGVNQITQ